MSDTDCKEDEVLKRMLKTPPKKNEPKGRSKKSGADAKSGPAEG